MATIEIRTFVMGNDVVFLVAGGTAHIGAMATAWISSEAPFVQSYSLALPGHREGELAVELAELASRTLNRTVAVLAGIHLERPSKQAIEAIVEKARNGMRETLEQWNIEARE
ncbi:hypothetical protein [Cohnella panacarvi]|uniref:prenylated flavin chaperone LpdD n=1 Tax=Cohnella panacarvi TaxID=400776 RepID=UPI00047C98DF|nr:hypothetical protein [Cohnella panacarvi]